MTEVNEIYRIDNNVNGELPNTAKIVIRVESVKNANTLIENTKGIMKLISNYAFQNDWPSEEEWTTILPEWFVESMTLKTSEDRDKDENLWHFESWIDNMRQRFWYWFSSKVEENTIIIVLEPISIPYLYDSLVYVLYSQGVSIESISVSDDIYDAF